MEKKGTTETVADIVKEMRGTRGFPVPYSPARGVWLDDLRAFAERIDAAHEREGNQFRDATKKIGDAAKESEAAGPRAPERAAHGMVALVAPVCAGAGWTERTGETPVPPEARMRKALELLLAQATEYINKGLVQIPWPLENACKEARAALAAPLRNCDRFATAEEAGVEYSAFCDAHHNAAKEARGLDGCDDCPLVERGRCLCTFAWLFAPAKEGEVRR